MTWVESIIKGQLKSHLCVPGIICGWGMPGESKISSFCFLCGTRERTFYVQEGGCKDFLLCPQR